MSFEEKRAWIYAVIALGVPVGYFAVVLGRLRDSSAADVAYVWPLVIATGVAMLLNIVATIAAGAVSPKDVVPKDERDVGLDRRGEYVGFHVISLVALVPLGLAMAGVEHFWIANAIYLAFVLSAFASAVVKIVGYRRGF